jgi:hypothetical protein
MSFSVAIFVTIYAASLSCLLTNTGAEKRTASSALHSVCEIYLPECMRHFEAYTLTSSANKHVMETVNTTKIAFKNHKISAETVMFGMLHSLYVFFDMTH